MHNHDWMEVFNLSDPGQSVAVRVALNPEHEVFGKFFYPSEITVKSSFVSGILRLSLSSQDLEFWGQCLGDLERGEDISWPPEGRSARIEVFPEDPLVLKVVDSPASQISVYVPVDSPLEDFLDDSRASLARVLSSLRSE